MYIHCITADYADARQARHIVKLLDEYAQSPTGGGTCLEERVKNNLVAELSAFPGAFSVLCYVDQRPAGLVNSFMGFSTFKCKPLINIHDIVVASEFRGQGLSQVMLNKVEEIAKDRGCCKLTLEVLANNIIAQGAYRKFGFAAYQLNPEMGQAMFWEKSLAGK